MSGEFSKGEGRMIVDGPSRKRAAFVALPACLALSIVLAGCSVGPKYQRPSVQTPPAYKEPTAQNVYETEAWKQAQPSDATIAGKWWETFNDAQLNALEEQVDVSNQNVASAAAAFLAARALVKQSRSQYFPNLTVNPSITNSRPSGSEFGGVTAGGSSSSSNSGFSLTSFTGYSLPFDASWQPDFWGRVRNTVNSNVFAAQAGAADLENVRLTAQAEVAVDYYEIRAQDGLKQLLDQTVAAYQDSLDLTQIQFRAGIASDEAVAQAETQLETTQAADTNLGIQRAQFEHALALLLGQPASTFSLPVEPLNANPPSVPFAVPSQLLERRPDIAAGERLMASANAQIGVAQAAYYPNITLSASAGFGSTSIVDWFTWPSRFWSVGPSLAETLFDAGLRRATVQQVRALYDQTVANYRQTVLTAFEQVEDNLAALRILSREIQQQDTAIQSATRNLQVATDRYRAGIDQYLNVILAQTTLLTNQEAAVNLREQEMLSSVQLIEALGGGWNAAQMPTPKQIGAKALTIPPNSTP
jgi:NodT family efflux transporter outer membrane factor (OMF) lipoprotein